MKDLLPNLVENHGHWKRSWLVNWRVWLEVQ